MTVQITEVSYQLTKPVITARGIISDRTGYRIEFKEDGHVGEGECMPLPGFSKISHQEAKAQLIAATSRVVKNPELSNEVRAGLGIATWNLKANQMGSPLWALLGGSVDSIRVNSLVAGGTESELIKSLKVSRQQGITTFKVKMGFDEDLERIRVLSQNVKESERIRLDPNGAWLFEKAVDHIEVAKKELGERLQYVEDPVRDLHQLIRLRSNIDFPVATDDLTRNPDDLEVAIQNKLAEYVVLKPSLIGGIDQTVTVSNHLAEKGIHVVLSSTYDGPVGLRAWCELAASIAPEISHGLGTAMYIHDDQMHSLIPENGIITLDF